MKACSPRNDAQQASPFTQLAVRLARLAVNAPVAPAGAEGSNNKQGRSALDDDQSRRNSRIPFSVSQQGRVGKTSINVSNTVKFRRIVADDMTDKREPSVDDLAAWLHRVFGHATSWKVVVVIHKGDRNRKRGKRRGGIAGHAAPRTEAIVVQIAER